MLLQMVLTPLAFQVWQGFVREWTPQVRAFAGTKHSISESLQLKYLHRRGLGYEVVVNDLKETAYLGLYWELNGVFGTKRKLVCYIVFFI